MQRDDFPEPGDPRNWSGWTRWVSRRIGQAKGFRAFFNRGVGAKEWLARSIGKRAGNPASEPLRLLRDASPEVRTGLGGQLLDGLLGELAAVRQSRQRVFAAVSQIDAPEVLNALKALGKRLYLVLGPGVDGVPRKSGAKSDHNAAARKELKTVLLRRSPDRYMAGAWYTVAGRMEAGETAVQTALRELREETALHPLDLYCLDRVGCFYLPSQDTLWHAIIFCAIVSADAPVCLNPEREAFRWVSRQISQQPCHTSLSGGTVRFL